MESAEDKFFLRSVCVLALKEKKKNPKAQHPKLRNLFEVVLK